MVGTFLLVAFIWFVVSKRRQRRRRGLDHWRGQVEHHLGKVEQQLEEHIGRVDRGGWLDTYRGGARVAQRRQEMARGDSSGDLLSARPPQPPAPETPMDALQRRYVADEISVEEYERQLDELLKKK